MQIIPRRKENVAVPYVLGDDLLCGVGEVEVDEVGEAGHGRRLRWARAREVEEEGEGGGGGVGLRRRDRRGGGRLYNGRRPGGDGKQVGVVQLPPP